MLVFIRPAAIRALAICLLAMSVSGCSSGGNQPAPNADAFQIAPVRIVDSHPSGAPAFVVRLQADARPIKASAARQLTVDDPVYKHAKTYEGVLLDELLTRAMSADAPADVPLPDDTHLVLVATDGYRSPVSLRTARASHAVLAFRDVEAPAGSEWAPLPPGRAVNSPAPYYLVWPRDTPGHVPWPYGVVEIEVWRADPLALAAPPAGGDAAAGFELFRKKCISCHAINGTGGTFGPELNVPANVTEYWAPAALRQFIRDPASIRANAKMPKIAELDDQAIRTIEAYLREMRNHKISVRKRPGE